MLVTSSSSYPASSNGSVSATLVVLELAEYGILKREAREGEGRPKMSCSSTEGSDNNGVRVFRRTPCVRA